MNKKLLLILLCNSIYTAVIGQELHTTNIRFSDTCLLLSILDQKENSSLKIYSNPANQHIRFESQEIVLKTQLIDVHGRTLIDILTPENKIDVSQIEGGLYHLIFYCEKNRYTHKIIIKR